jgi:hypothetical protein
MNPLSDSLAVCIVSRVRDSHMNTYMLLNSGEKDSSSSTTHTIDTLQQQKPKLADRDSHSQRPVSNYLNRLSIQDHSTLKHD